MSAQPDLYLPRSPSHLPFLLSPVVGLRPRPADPVPASPVASPTATPPPQTFSLPCDPEPIGGLSAVGGGTAAIPPALSPRGGPSTGVGEGTLGAAPMRQERRYGRLAAALPLPALAASYFLRPLRARDPAAVAEALLARLPPLFHLGALREALTAAYMHAQPPPQVRATHSRGGDRL